MDPDQRLRLSTITSSELSSYLNRLRGEWAGNERPLLPPTFVSHLARVLDKDNQVFILSFCRWAAAFCPQNQESIFNFMADPVLTLLNGAGESDIVSLGLKVIGNTLVGNGGNCEKFITGFGLQVPLKHMMSTDSRISETALILALTLTQLRPELINFSTRELSTVLDNESGTAILWLEALFQIPGFISSYYPSLQVESRVKLLHVIISHPVCQEGLDNESIAFFALLFSSLSDTILNSTRETFPLEITSHVELFCKLVLLPGIGVRLKLDRTFVASVIVVLRAIHDAGLSSDNSLFTPVHKLDLALNPELESHPAYAFKANLIRLVGSLCQGQVENQDLVFELGSLRVILDCTKIDALNPFIPQCSIVALKFILENNSRNQDYVKGMRNEGFLPLDI